MLFNTRRRSFAAVTGILLAAAIVPAAAQNGGTATPGGWAIVGADGTLGPNTNVMSVKRVKAGNYRVKFNQDVSRCAANATIAAQDGDTLVPGYIIAGRHNTALNEIRVHTFLTTTLVPSDYQFDLLVTC
jgi:hypothetical protein